MEHFYKNLGEDWFSYSELYNNIVKTHGDGSHFVEVGSWKGRSSAYMAVEINNSGKNIKFDCVDIWEKSEEYSEENLYEQFLTNIKPVKHIINPIKMKSVDASKLYEDNSLDFVFIDACHFYECVKEDLEAWYPKVKLNGIIAGHDFHSENIRKAVEEQFTQFYFSEQQDIWLKTKK